MGNNERILKTARRKDQVAYKGIPVRIIPEFSMETLKARKKGLGRCSTDSVKKKNQQVMFESW